MTSPVDRRTLTLKAGWTAFTTMGHMTSRWWSLDTKPTCRTSELSLLMKERRYINELPAEKRGKREHVCTPLPTNFVYAQCSKDLYMLYTRREWASHVAPKLYSAGFFSKVCAPTMIHNIQTSLHLCCIEDTLTLNVFVIHSSGVYYYISATVCLSNSCQTKTKLCAVSGSLILPGFQKREDSCVQ